jgi:hypothetical protein
MIFSSSGNSIRSILSSSLIRHLPGLGSLIAEAVDERLQMMNALLLVPLIGLQLSPALRLLFQVTVVIARIEISAAIPDLQDSLDRDVQEITVVRDEHKREGIAVQVLLQPIAGFKVQMVGRLVEQQDIRLGQKELGQSDAHLPSAREFFHTPGQILTRKAQSIEHLGHLGFQRVALVLLEFRLDPMIAVGNFFVLATVGIELRHLVREGFHLFFDLQ